MYVKVSEIQLTETYCLFVVVFWWFKKRSAERLNVVLVQPRMFGWLVGCSRLETFIRDKLLFARWSTLYINLHDCHSGCV